MTINRVHSVQEALLDLPEMEDALLKMDQLISQIVADLVDRLEVAAETGKPPEKTSHSFSRLDLDTLRRKRANLLSRKNKLEGNLSRELTFKLLTFKMMNRQTPTFQKLTFENVRCIELHLAR